MILVTNVCRIDSKFQTQKIHLKKDLKTFSLFNAEKANNQIVEIMEKV